MAERRDSRNPKDRRPQKEQKPYRGPAKGPREQNEPRAPKEPRGPEESSEREEPEQGGELIWGRHAAIATLQGDRPVNKVWLLRTLMEGSTGAQIRQFAKEKGAIVSVVERGKLDRLVPGANHQGIVVSVAARGYVELEEVIEAAKAQPQPLLLVLDGVEDPHNLGALIRTAVGAGVQGVIIPQRRAVGLTGTVDKASAGTLEKMPIARVGNLTNAINTLKDAGFWIVSADGSGKQMPYDVDFKGSIAIVVGGEGSGVSRLVLDNSDFVVRIPMIGELQSYNASVAGGMLMYEAMRQRLAEEPTKK